MDSESSTPPNSWSNLKTELRWLLEGHNLKGNDMSYVRTTEKRLRQEYEKAIDALTIDQANILQRKVETLQVEKSLLDNYSLTIKGIQRKIALIHTGFFHLSLSYCSAFRCGEWLQGYDVCNACRRINKLGELNK